MKGLRRWETDMVQNLIPAPLSILQISSRAQNVQIQFAQSVGVLYKMHVRLSSLIL
jgi:hypothetical protein